MVSIISATFLFDNAVFLSCSCISCDKWHYLIWSTLELLRACVTNHSLSLPIMLLYMYLLFNAIFICSKLANFELTTICEWPSQQGAQLVKANAGMCGKAHHPVSKSCGLNALN